MCQTMSGLCCLTTGMLVAYSQLPQAQIFVVALGTNMAAMAFNLVYLHCSEMYPTSIRGSMTGMCSTVGRVGGIYALSLDGLRTTWEPLPFILIGAQAVVAGVLAISLPETVGCKLPETMQDAIDKVGKDCKKKPWCPSKRVSPTNGM